MATKLLSTVSSTALLSDAANVTSKFKVRLADGSPDRLRWIVLVGCLEFTEAAAQHGLEEVERSMRASARMDPSQVTRNFSW